MPNKRYSNLVKLPKDTGLQVEQMEQPDGGVPNPSLPMKSAAWPGVPGKSFQRAPFYVKSQGIK